MENIAHNYLTKLRIISKIPENGQLDLTNNDLNIYTPSLVGWIHRKMSGDGKMNTVGFLRSLYQELTTFTNEIMSAAISEPIAAIKRNRYSLLANIAKKIKESQVGFVRLKQTYSTYPKIISMLESIEQDIIETQLRRISAFLPDSRKLDRPSAEPMPIPSAPSNSPEISRTPPPPANTPAE
jgi:hypothetical protein